MCCCSQPNVNGTPNGYSHDGKSNHTYPPNPPALQEGDELFHDEPGRCGGVDSHSHHFRIVKQQYGGLAILVRHGGGDERIPLGHRNYILGAMHGMDSNARYWLMLGVYHVHQTAARKATDEVDAKWRKAAAEKRIKTRKQPGRGFVKVTIVDAALAKAGVS